MLKERFLMSKRIVVRADDLGYSEGVNYGIAKSVRDGIIRSVGVMTNMPTVQHGLDLLAGVDVCYGQHTNICVGRPLTDPKLIPSICQENGEFRPSRDYREAAKKGEDFVAVDEVVLEIEAQYQRFVELTGQQPHYFEGHAVASDNFFKGLEIVAKRHGLDYLPVSFFGPVRFRNTLLYTSMDSMAPDYDPFECLKRDALKDYGSDGCCMFVCHPGYLDDFILRTSSLTIPRTKEVAMACNPATLQWLKDNDVKVITYDDLT
jgi:predicted glycoside hydrolase/deacetylase ChbG (UPF0249 family)